MSRIPERLTFAAIAAVCLSLASLSATAMPLATFQNGGDRLATTQNADGGWGWPLTGGSAKNTIAPITMGLAQAYRETGLASQLTALNKAGTFFLNKSEKYSTADGYIAAELDSVFGVTTYSDHIKSNYFDKLAAGTYNRDGGTTLLSTVDEIQRVINYRSGGNLAAWDIGMGLVGAVALGIDTSDWITGTENTINFLDGNNDFDVLGLAGAVFGLASAGADFDPTSGEHAAAGSLSDLAAALASYQIDGGGFTWNKNHMIAGYDETIQETAYATLALSQFNHSLYAGEINGAAGWLTSTQLTTGGWENYAGSPQGENNEVTGEALWALHASVPEPPAGILFGLGLAALGVVRHRRRHVAG